MASKIERVLVPLDRFCQKAGIAVSLLSLVLMILIVATVFMRYVLNVSFIWSFPLSRQIFAVFILFAIVYTMVSDAHLRVEVLYDRFPRRFRLIADVIDLLAFLLFTTALVWQSGLIARSSVSNLELSQGSPKVPLYIIKSIVPVVAVLLLLQGLSFFYRHVKRTNKKPESGAANLVHINKGPV